MKLFEQIDICIKPDALLVLHQHYTENIAELNDGRPAAKVWISRIQPFKDLFGQYLAGVTQFYSLWHVFYWRVRKQFHALTRHDHRGQTDLINFTQTRSVPKSADIHISPDESTALF